MVSDYCSINRAFHMCPECFFICLCDWEEASILLKCGNTFLTQLMVIIHSIAPSWNNVFSGLIMMKYSCSSGLYNTPNIKVLNLFVKNGINCYCTTCLHMYHVMFLLLLSGQSSKDDLIHWLQMLSNVALYK